MIFFILFIFQCQQAWHTAVKHIGIQSLSFVTAHMGVELFKGQREYMNLSSTATELCSNVLWQPFGVTAGHIHIQIFICFEFIEHIIDRNLDPAVYLVNNPCGKLNFVNEKIKLLIFLFRNKGFDIFTKCDWISELVITSLIQFDFYDVIFLNALWEKILIKQIKQQYRLSTAADAGDYLDLTVPHIMNHAV